MISNISIIFPVFNESIRLSTAFGDIKKLNKKNLFKKIEYVFVDDGSTDNSIKKIEKFIIKNKKKNINYKMIILKKNKGKGEALKRGILASKSDWILTIDTDISVSLQQVITWIKKGFINKKNEIYFGSRNLRNSQTKYKIYRKLLGLVFNKFINYYFSIELSDTQCGFKLYKSKVGKKLFKNLQDKGFAHDIEIVLRAEKFNFQITELPVKWEHKDNSKLNIFSDSFKMLLNLIYIKRKVI